MDELRIAVSRYFEDRGSFDLQDYIHAHGDPRQALLLFGLFFPDLTEVAGHVVLARYLEGEGEPTRLQGAIESNPDTLQATLAGYRWVEVPYEFANLALDDADDELLASLVARSWGAALAAQYPGRSWSVRIIPPHETGSVVGVCFEEVA